MIRVLFVDDEPKLLEGLQRSLRSMRNDWTMTFVVNGEDALKTLEKSPIDVVVSDMRMPGMDGSQLLNVVLQRYPHIIRIILSGHSDQEVIFQSIGATHQFLSKPCETERLKDTIRRACALRDMLNNEHLRALTTGICTIPSLPTLYTEIKKEVESENCSLQTLGTIIAKDIGMTAKVLQLANSAYFGLAQNVSTAEHAVKLLGLDTIQALVLSAHIFSQFPPGKAGAFPIDQLWTESMNTALVARAIAQAEERPPAEIEQAFTAGLLHDAGMLLLAVNESERYRAVLVNAATEERTIWEAEQNEFGATHAELCASLLGLWGLSAPIVEAVAFHHRPSTYLGQAFVPLTAVHVAETLQQKRFMDCPPPVLDLSYLERLNLVERLPHWRDVAMMAGKEITQ